MSEYNTRAGWKDSEPPFPATSTCILTMSSPRYFLCLTATCSHSCVDPSPGWGDALTNFNVKDIAIVGASTAFAGTAAFFGSTTHALRGPTARVAMVVGASAGQFSCRRRPLQRLVLLFVQFSSLCASVPWPRLPHRLPELLGSSHGLQRMNSY